MICIVLSANANGEKFKSFDNYQLHYNVVNTTFLSPLVADKHGITRGNRYAILTLSLRKNANGSSFSTAMNLSARTWDLIQSQDLQFSEVRETEAIYYLAEFKFINEEWRHFNIEFIPEDSNQKYQFKFKHQLYIN